MQIANVKQRQIWFPRVGKIWASTPQNLASEDRRQISRLIAGFQRLRRHDRHAYRHNNYTVLFCL